MRTKKELARLQHLPLEEKIALTKLRITEWYEHYEGNVHVTFSGGKDSTVLLTIARELYPDILAVYVDTGLEFPEVKQHVKTFPNVEILRPEMNFRQVIDTYGFVYPSKDVAYSIRRAKSGKKWAIDQLNGVNKDGSYSEFRQRYKKWAYLMNAPFNIDDRCCEIMKEKPLRDFERRTKSKPIIGIMASESNRRMKAWERTGCNAFDSDKPKSKPLSFWTEQDILAYIVKYGIKIPSVYGDIVKDKKGKYKTTGEQRTGRMFCLIGAHLDKENRFQRMAKTHPNIYKYCMEQLGIREVLEWLKIPYKPVDDGQINLFDEEK